MPARTLDASDGEAGLRTCPPGAQAARAPRPAPPAYPRFIVRIQAAATFAPCPVDDGDELFPNGIFVFNVTRILEHVARHPEEVALVQVSVGSFPRWGRPLADAHVEAADLARPVLLAEISPGAFNLIDGHHRLEKARRSDVETLAALLSRRDGAGRQVRGRCSPWSG